MNYLINIILSLPCFLTLSVAIIIVINYAIVKWNLLYGQFSSNCMNYIGKRFGFVWGEGSKNYSEMVIRSYLCRHGSDLRNPSGIGLFTLAAIHHSGSNVVTQPATTFRQMVQHVFNDGKC